MGTNTCDGCGRRISVAGSVENVWTFGEDDGSEGTAMTLEFPGGSTHLLCYPCIAALPEEPTAATVDRLAEVDAETSTVRER